MKRGILAVLIVAPLVGCEPEASEVTPEEGTMVAEVARPVAGELLRTLVGRLTSAMEEGGPVGAIGFCSEEALPLTRRVQEGQDLPVTLKRTSFRHRNPANAPDEAEEEALLFFERALQEGSAAPSHFVQRVSAEEMRYYQPLFVGEVCLGCHGDPATMDPQVVQAILRKSQDKCSTRNWSTLTETAILT